MAWPAEETWVDSKNDKGFCFFKLLILVKRLNLSPIGWLVEALSRMGKAVEV
jgi:hypothetical protein